MDLSRDGEELGHGASPGESAVDNALDAAINWLLNDVVAGGSMNGNGWTYIGLTIEKPAPDRNGDHRAKWHVRVRDVDERGRVPAKFDALPAGKRTRIDDRDFLRRHGSRRLGCDEVYGRASLELDPTGDNPQAPEEDTPQEAIEASLRRLNQDGVYNVGWARKKYCPDDCGDIRIHIWIRQATAIVTAGRTRYFAAWWLKLWCGADEDEAP